MATAYIFYNPYAGDGHGKEHAVYLGETLDSETVLCDMTKPETYERYLFEPKAEDALILCGGDGTLHHFINLVEGIDIPSDILYYPCGIQNDFARNLGMTDTDRPFSIKNALQSLPYVEVKDRKHRFLNGIGYGLDSSCLAAFYRLKKADEKMPPYQKLIRKMLFREYEPTDATVTVDGKTYRFSNVWCAPTVNGKFFTGGTLPCNRAENALSLAVIHTPGKLKTWKILRCIMNGSGKEMPEDLDILTGREITVEFNRPIPLCMDGELLKEVTSYKAVMA